MGLGTSPLTRGNGVGIPPDGEMFFPRMKGRDEALRLWWKMKTVEWSGMFCGIRIGSCMGSSMLLMGKVELAVSVGNTKIDDSRILKINTAYPIRTQGLSEVLDDDTVRIRDSKKE